MNKIIYLFAILLLISLIVFLKTHDQKDESVFLHQSIFNKDEVKTISKNLAHLLSSDLHEFTPYYDFNEILHIMSEIEKGQIQLIPSQDSHIALMNFKYKILENTAQRHLENINHFFSQLAQKNNVVEVKKEKLFYEIIQKGSGEIVVENSTPLIHFTEYDLSGTILQDTQKDGPQRISLREVIPGFRQGVIGMHVGEKRKIYIHPDLAYGKIGKYAPQELVIFIVEIIDS
jgi:peptidylprolyl isomerase